MDTFISTLLDQLQKKLDESKNEYQKKILRRLIAILEEYIP